MLHNCIYLWCFWNMLLIINIPPLRPGLFRGGLLNSRMKVSPSISSGIVAFFSPSKINKKHPYTISIFSITSFSH